MIEKYIQSFLVELKNDLRWDWRGQLIGDLPTMRGKLLKVIERAAKTSSVDSEVRVFLQEVAHTLHPSLRSRMSDRDLDMLRNKALKVIHIMTAFNSEEQAMAAVEEAASAKAWKVTPLSATFVRGRELRNGDKVRLKVVTITNISNGDKEFSVEEGDFSREERDRFDFSMIDEVVEYVENSTERHERIEKENAEMREIIKELDPEYYAKRFK